MYPFRMASGTETAEDNYEIAVYHKGELLCLVVHSECKEYSLSDFRSKVLLEQVPDNLPREFLFIRFFGGKEIAINKKQEHLFMVRQCLKIQDAFLTVAIVTDDIDVPFSQPQSASPLQQSNQRKRKLPAQATLPSFGFKIPNKSSNERLSHAKARNIKLYSETEIGNSTGKMKIYRQYWNNKAEDICANKEFANFSKAAVHGVINTAWTLKKADDMLTEAKKMATALKDVPKSCLTGSSVCENNARQKYPKAPECTRKDQQHGECNYRFST